MSPGKTTSNLWPSITYTDFEPTHYLLHMLLQMVGKLKLSMPFQSQWSDVPLWLNARGLTTGPIPYVEGVYEVRTDFVSHELQWFTSSGVAGKLLLGPTSVATLVETFLDGLRHVGIDPTITFIPQEVANRIPFDKDDRERPYDRDMVNAWWRVLLSTQRVMQVFQGRFTGKTQPIGFMWGTCDICVPFYNGKSAAPAPNAGFIRGNAMNAELMEMGWWSGGPSYPRPAFYSFTYPQPQGIERAIIQPTAARWEAGMGEFLLDYDDLRQSRDPDRDLLAFLESTYSAGATSSAWDTALLGSGHPKRPPATT